MFLLELSLIVFHKASDYFIFVAVISFHFVKKGLLFLREEKTFASKCYAGGRTLTPVHGISS